MKELRGLCKVFLRRIGGRKPRFLLPPTMEDYEKLVMRAKEVKDRRILAIKERAEKIEAEANRLQLQADEVVSSAREKNEAARELARREARRLCDMAFRRWGEALDHTRAIKRARRYSWMMPGELDPSYPFPPGLLLTCEDWAEEGARRSEREEILFFGKTIFCTLGEWQEESDANHIARKYRVERRVVGYSGQIFLFIIMGYEKSSPRIHKALRASMAQMRDEELCALAATEQ